MLIIQANNIHESGARYLLLAILKSIRETRGDLQVTVFLDARFERELLVDVLFDGRIKVKSINPNIVSRLWSEYCLSRLTNLHRCSTVLCMGNLPPLFNCNARVVLYLQTVLYFRAFEKFLEGMRARVKLLLEKLWIRFRIKNVKHIVVQSQLVAETLCAEYSVDKRVVSVMPFANLEDLISEVPPTPASERNGFFYPALGTPHKNHKLLIDAWVLLARQGRYPMLILTIDQRFTSLLKYLEHAILEYKINVTNLGLISHAKVIKQMVLSEAMIFPSFCESFGLPLLEARENAIPVIASERDYVREIMNPTETFDPESALSIARAVNRFLGAEESALKLEKPAALVDLISENN